MRRALTAKLGRRREMNDKIDVDLTVNGVERSGTVEPRRTLADMLREDLGLTGTHLGCEHGRMRRLHGPRRRVTRPDPVSCWLRRLGDGDPTIEGLADGDELNPSPEGDVGQPLVPVWVLHAWLSYADHGVAAGKQTRRASRDTGGLSGQRLPLHRIRGIVNGVLRAAGTPAPSPRATALGGRMVQKSPSGSPERSVKRVEDPRILTGRGKYVDDVRLPGHGPRRLLAESVRPCQYQSASTPRGPAGAGVLAVYTGEELERVLIPGPTAPPGCFPGQPPMPRQPGYRQGPPGG